MQAKEYCLKNVGNKITATFRESNKKNADYCGYKQDDEKT